VRTGWQFYQITSRRQALELEFEIIVKTGEDAVDMKAGLETFQGMSDAARKIATSFANDQVLKRINYKSDIKTRLKHSFKGSYGQRFSIDIQGGAEQRAINEMGTEVFVELLSHTMMAARYGRTPNLSKSAQVVLDAMRMSEIDLIDEIRSSCMRRVHKVPAKFNQDVLLRHAPKGAQPVVVAHFDRSSAKLLDPIFDPVEVEIRAAVSRLNINTGNGRCKLLGEKDTVAFGFSGDYFFIDVDLKKHFSENLDANNGTPQEHWSYIPIRAQRVKLNDGKVVKYLIRGMA